MPRALAPLALLAIAVIAVWWIWMNAPAPVAEPAAVATPIATATSLAAIVPTPAPEERYRLAGTAVGDPVSYAAIEMPDGSSSLYRQGAEIGGLGRLSEIHADHVVIAGSDGDVILQLKPAPTPTIDPRKLGRAPKRTFTPAEAPELEPELEVDLDDTTDESEPGDDPDLPAS